MRLEGGVFCLSIQNKCVVSLGSVTVATRAQRALANAALYSEIVKLGDDPLGKGCAYGLEFGCSAKGNVKTVLESAGIRIRGFSADGGGGGP